MQTATAPKPGPSPASLLKFATSPSRRQDVNRSAWGTAEWLSDAEAILAARRCGPGSLRLLNGHVVAMSATIAQLRAQLEPLMLTEAHQIRELSVEAVIRDANGLVLEKQDDLDGSASYWVAPGNSDEMFSANTIALPAQLLFRP